MSYYRTCPLCGAHLDPCERCDYQSSKEEAPASAANAGEGAAEQSLNESVSASTIHENGGFVK